MDTHEVLHLAEELSATDGSSMEEEQSVFFRDVACRSYPCSIRCVYTLAALNSLCVQEKGKRVYVLEIGEGLGERR